MEEKGWAFKITANYEVLCLDLVYFWRLEKYLEKHITQGIKLHMTNNYPLCILLLVVYIHIFKSVMKIITRRRYLKEVNEQFGLYLLHRWESNSFFFLCHIHDQITVEHRKRNVCCFIAKFILKIKVCKCSKYSKLLIYMSLLTQL